MAFENRKIGTQINEDFQDSYEFSFIEIALLNPPSAPLLKGGNGGISADSLLNREM